MTQDYQILELGDFPLLSGAVLRDAKLAYQTYGTLAPERDNVIVLPTFYTGTNSRNEGFFGPGRAIDPARHFIVSPNLFGNGRSSSPTNTLAPQDGPRFPLVQMWDNIAAQHRLIHDHLGIDRAVFAGMSQGGYLSLRVALGHPDRVRGLILMDTQAALEDPEVLEGYLGDLSTEIAHTDSYEFRQGLKERREVLARIVESLRQEVPSSG